MITRRFRPTLLVSMALAALETAHPAATFANSPEPQLTAESITTDHP